MQIEKQVTSLEISKRLKELGVKQESLFIWNKVIDSELSADIFLTYKNPIKDGNIKNYSAFTVAELGEMLPARVEKDNEFYMLQCLKHKEWEVKYVTYRNRIGFILNSHKIIQWGNEADARGKMLIYLIENKLITL